MLERLGLLGALLLALLVAPARAADVAGRHNFDNRWHHHR